MTTYFKWIIEILKYYLANNTSKYHDDLEHEIESTLTHFEKVLLNHSETIMASNKSSDWTELYKLGLIGNKTQRLKDMFACTFEQIAASQDISDDSFIKLVTPLYRAVQLNAYLKLNDSSTYFVTAAKMIEGCKISSRKQALVSMLNFEDIWRKLLHTLEKTTDEKLLVPFFQFMRASLHDKNISQTWGENNSSQLVTLANKFLIDSSGIQRVRPILQTSEAREAFYHFLGAVCSSDRVVREAVSKFFVDLLIKAKWRFRSSVSWLQEFTPINEKSSDSTGLVNLHSTCYMNSIFQQVFATHNFRDYIIDAKHVNQSEEDNKDILKQFQQLLRGLRDSNQPSYNPSSFCDVFTNMDGTKVNVKEQMDADEFFNNLLDKLENQMAANQKAAIKRCYGGRMLQQVISSECSHGSSGQTDFLRLSVDIKGLTSLKQALNKLVEGEMLEGDNLYHCDSCSKKVKAVRRETISTLPNNLVIVLKRMEFNFETMSRLKLNTYCEFPEDLDMRPYTHESIDEQGRGQTVRGDNYYQYKLKGFVIHQGSADVGHYYSIIKDKSGKWSEYNDQNISDFKFNQQISMAYGAKTTQILSSAGTPKTPATTPGMNRRFSFNTNSAVGKSAYILFYERDGLYDQNGSPVLDMMEGIDSTTYGEEDYGQMAILKENFDIHLKRIAFEAFFTDWILKCVRDLNFTQMNFTQNKCFVKAFLMSFLVVQLRTWNKFKTFDGIHAIKEKLQESKEVSEYFLTACSSEAFFEEFLLDCPVFIGKQIIVGLIAVAINTVLHNGDESEFIIVSSPNNSPSNSSTLGVQKPILTGGAIISNLAVLAVSQSYRNRSVDQLNFHIFKLIEYCTKNKHVSKLLGKLKVAEELMRRFKPGDNEKGNSLASSLNSKYISIDNEFDGYLLGLDSGENSDQQVVENPGLKSMVSGVEENIKELRRDAIASKYLKKDYSYLVMALCNMLKHNKSHGYFDIVNSLIAKGQWTSLSPGCTSSKSRRTLANLIVDEVKSTPSLVDITLEDCQVLFKKAQSVHEFKLSLTFMKQLVSSVPEKVLLA